MNLQTIFAQHRTRNIFFGLISFFYAFVIYFSTMAPTASFWDPAEYIAISHSLQIAHPPGSPFFALVGRLFSMFMPTDYVAASINTISVLASSFTIMLLYLVVVRLIQEWRGPADEMDLMDQIGLYAGGLFAALTFTVTHTHWFNAVEAEMYASSMFFTAVVVWMALRWSENHDKPKADRWLILIAYTFGLGIGVHLLNLLALFFVGMIVYYKKRETTFLSFVGMGLITIITFLVIFPFTIIKLPDLATDISRVTYGLIGPLTYFILIVVAIAFAVYYTHKKKLRLANLTALAYAMIILGYSSYALVFIRAQAQPPINENDPSTIESFVSYLNRDQYGTSPLLTGYAYNSRTGDIDRNREVFFPRRHSSQPHHLQSYANYDSEWQYFWQYQVNHMYFRYFNWNFIGREADIQDTGWYSGFSASKYANNPANSGYFYLPLLIGLLGMVYHFRNDWRRALAVLALFILTGLAIIFYLNQTPMEPRERDYAYAGSFFAFSIWIGIGMSGILEMVKQFSKSHKGVAFGTIGVLTLAVPLWMLVQNWPSHDRSGNYVPRDYAYNLLMSLEPNALLFTNGDNDTFPLWYLQEVERVRTDVRVVNLSLLNTKWYIHQMRDNQTHESLPLPIRFTDEEIDDITSGLILFNPQDIVIPVNKPLLEAAFSGEPIDELQGIVRTQAFEYQLQSAVPYSLPVEELDNEVRWRMTGRPAGVDQQGNPRFYLQAQDRMVLEILQANEWLRPVYYANTVSSQGQLGLQDFFQFEGKAFRIVPKRRPGGSFGFLDPEVHASRLENFRFERWNDHSVYFDENIRRMLGNYRYGFTELSDHYMREGNIEQAAYWLTKGEDAIPFRHYETDRLELPALYAYRLAKAEEAERALNLANMTKENLLHFLSFEMEALDRLENRINTLIDDAQRERGNARMERFQTLNRQIQRLRDRREEQMSNISFTISRLTIVQSVYYLTDNDELGDELALEVSLMSGARIPMPANRKENEDQIRRFNLGI